MPGTGKDWRPENEGERRPMNDYDRQESKRIGHLRDSRHPIHPELWDGINPTREHTRKQWEIGAAGERETWKDLLLWGATWDGDGLEAIAGVDVIVRGRHIQVKGSWHPHSHYFYFAPWQRHKFTADIGLLAVAEDDALTAVWLRGWIWRTRFEQIAKDDIELVKGKNKVWGFDFKKYPEELKPMRDLYALLDKTPL